MRSTAWAGALRRSPLSAIRRSGLGSARRRRGMGRTRARLLLGRRQAARRCQRPPCLPPGAQGHRRNQRGRVDAPGAPAQLRVSALRPGRSAGGDLPAGRTLRYSRDRGGLPEADPACDPDRCRGHGRHLRLRPTRVVGTRKSLVTQFRHAATSEGPYRSGKGPLNCYLAVGVAGFEPTTSSSRTKRAAKLRYTPIVAALAATSFTLAHRWPETKSGFLGVGGGVGPGRGACGRGRR